MCLSGDSSSASCASEIWGVAVLNGEIVEGISDLSSRTSGDTEEEVCDVVTCTRLLRFRSFTSLLLSRSDVILFTLLYRLSLGFKFAPSPSDTF